MGIRSVNQLPNKDDRKRRLWHWVARYVYRETRYFFYLCYSHSSCYLASLPVYTPPSMYTYEGQHI